MKLQAKVLLIMVVTWLIICAMVIADAKFIIAQDYRNLETSIVQHRIQDTQHALDRMLYSLSLYTLSWAQWDDAYVFMQTKNEKFIDTNFVNAIYRSAGLNFIMFFDTADRLHYGQSYDAKENRINPVPQALLDYILNNKSFITHSDVTSDKVGILQTKLGLIVMASRPVTMSTGKSPIRGSILMGYFLDDSFFKTLSETVGMNVDFVPISSALKNKQLDDAYINLNAGNKYTVSIVSSKLMYAFFSLKDIDNQPVGLVRVEIPRKIFQAGLWTSRHYVGIIIISGMLIIFLMGYLLKKFVLDRILNISKQVLRINKEREFDNRINLSGHDELSKMVYTINNMLDMISNSQSQLRYLANHDTLTQLPNREYFYELLSRAVINANGTKTKIAIMFLDMDKLKKVNDTYGHAVGDRLIQLASNRMRKSLREKDVIARQSGDEFIVFMQEITDKNIVTDTAKRILQVTSEPFVIGKINIKISFSIGISMYPTDGKNIEELVKRADNAMYSTKIKSGDDYQWYSEDTSTLK